MTFGNTIFLHHHGFCFCVILFLGCLPFPFPPSHASQAQSMLRAEVNDIHFDAESETHRPHSSTDAGIFLTRAIATKDTFKTGTHTHTHTQLNISQNLFSRSTPRQGREEKRMNERLTCYDQEGNQLRELQHPLLVSSEYLAFQVAGTGGWCYTWNLKIRSDQVSPLSSVWSS